MTTQQRLTVNELKDTSVYKYLMRRHNSLEAHGHRAYQMDLNSSTDLICKARKVSDIVRAMIVGLENIPDNCAVDMSTYGTIAANEKKDSLICFGCAATFAIANLLNMPPYEMVVGRNTDTLRVGYAERKLFEALVNDLRDGRVYSIMVVYYGDDTVAKHEFLWAISKVVSPDRWESKDIHRMDRDVQLRASTLLGELAMHTENYSMQLPKWKTFLMELCKVGL